MTTEQIDTGADGVKIEAGKFYRTRDGRKVGPMKRLNSRKYPFRSQVGAGIIVTFAANGRYFFGSDAEITPTDLVAEWSDTPVSPEPASPVRTEELEPVDPAALAFANWLRDGPRLAKQAGLYVAIKVYSAEDPRAGK